MGKSFKNKSGPFSSTPRPWEHLPPESSSPKRVARRTTDLPPPNSLLSQPTRFTPSVAPLAPPFKENVETCRDFLEHYTKLKPSFSEAVGAEGSLPPNPPLAHRREKRPFGAVSYMLRKKPLPLIKKTRPLRKLAIAEMEAMVTPPSTPKEKARIDRVMRSY